MDIVTLALSKSYTRKKIAESQSAGITRKVVSSLPTTGEDNVIYMVPNGKSSPNYYDEYMWINSAWEKIGTTEAVTYKAGDGISISEDNTISVSYSNLDEVNY